MIRNSKFSQKKGPAVSGFALVIALSLMAFVLLLLLSLTAFINVETRSSNLASERMKARQNALLGLQVAIGELQRAVGPDARATAKASVFDANNAENPHWLGAFKTYDPANPAYLVDEIRAESVDRSGVSAGRRDIDWLVSINPDATAANVAIDPVTQNAEAINGSAANTVVIAKMGASPIVEVEVGKVLVDQSGGSTSGKYAWWVSDESQKAKLNLLPPSAEDFFSSSGILSDSDAQGLRFAIAQAPKFDGITDLSGFTDEVDGLNGSGTKRASAQKSLSSSQIGSLNSRWETYLEENWDSVTFYSESIPVDVTTGKLKEDLSVYFSSEKSAVDGILADGENTSLVDARLGIAHTFADLTGVSQQNVPTFKWLDAWYQRGREIASAGGTGVTPVAGIETGQGLHPVVVSMGMVMHPTWQMAGGAGMTWGPADVFEIQTGIIIRPRIVLWNPYNVKLAASDYTVKVGYLGKFMLRPQLNGQAGRSTGGNFGYFIYPEIDGKDGEYVPEHATLGAGEDFPYRDYADGNAFLTFTIPAQSLEPGQQMVFYPNGPGAYDLLGNNQLSSVSAPEDYFSLMGSKIFNFAGQTIEDVIPGTLAGMSSASIESDIDNLFGMHFDSRFNNPHAPTINPEDLEIVVNLYNEDGAELFHSVVVPFEAGHDEEFFASYPPVSLIGGAGVTMVDLLNEAASDASGGDSRFPVLGMSLSLFGTYGNGTLSDWEADYLAIKDMASQTKAPRVGVVHNTLENWNLRARNYYSHARISPRAAYRSEYGTIDYERWQPAYGFQDYQEYADIVDDLGIDFYTKTNTSPGRLGDFRFEGLVRESAFPLFEYPSLPYGPISLGQLQQANLSPYAWQPTFAFGNGQAAARVPRSDFLGSQDNIYDASYVLNTSLWDRLFVSTIPYDDFDDSDVIEGQRFLNNRHVIRQTSSLAFEPDSLSGQDAYASHAAYLRVDGGFNVNSTSVDAWEAMLSGLLNESTTARDGNRSNDTSVAPLGKLGSPIVAESNTVIVDRTQTDLYQNNPWLSTRSLSQQEIRALAVRIVDEVQTRGPFLSVADFVNRRLDTSARYDDYTGLLGTLQAAITRNSVEGDPETGVKTIFNHHFYKSFSGSDKFQLDHAALTESHPQSTPGSTGSYQWGTEERVEAMLGIPIAEMDTHDVSGTTIAHTPAFISQGDILEKIGPALTVRGDTFVVRSYGESFNAVTNELSEAWCEAVLQRVAEPVNWDGAIQSLVEPSQNSQNAEFGRKFEIIGFRWLSPDEV